jgi:hypothetical protein
MITTSNGIPRLCFTWHLSNSLELYISPSDPSSECFLSCKNPSALVHQWLGYDSTENLRNEALSEIDQAGNLEYRLQATAITDWSITRMTTFYSVVILLAATHSHCVAASLLSTPCRLPCSPKTGSITSKKYHPVAKLAE